MKNIKFILKGALLYTTILLVIVSITTLDSGNGVFLEVYLLILSGVGILACYIHLTQEDINKLLFKDKLFEE